MSVEPSDHDDYAIVIYSKLTDSRELSRLFEQELQIVPNDAIVWTHHIPGVLNESFSEETARDLVSALARMGLHASAVRRDEIPHLHQAVAAHHAFCADEGMHVQKPLEHSSIFIPWAGVQMICVGEVLRDLTRRHPPNGLSVSLNGHQYQRPAVNVPFTPILEAWITCQSPLPHLRFDQDRMTFEYLGPRRTASASTNFRHFILDAIEHAPEAFVPESTQAFLKNDHQGQHRFKDPEALRHYATLQALLARETSTEVSPKTVA